MDGQIDGLIDGWMHVCMDGWMEACMHDGSMGRQTD